MTAIAAITHNGVVTMGGDSASVGDSHYLKHSATPKVFEVGPLLIGYTSSFAMGHALQHRLTFSVEEISDIPAANDAAALDKWMATIFADKVRALMREVGFMSNDKGAERGGTFLVGLKGHIYCFDSDYHALRCLEGYAACGSGVTACMAALCVLTKIKPAPSVTIIRTSSRKARPFEPLPEGDMAVEMIELALEAAHSCVTTVRPPFHIIQGGRA
ncbi:hypothetical protein [Sphingopyxis sp. GW247-27LB]|uniref:hypothetical protein n=1 Tax=Sphingopyxis sp. GW247-27LB TaxID=2012632 RepID=UPI000BA74D18|nr:hypothetical protein [Sphingopyxis sp. GW247-27LB]PAL23590.1 hypothetical protein CD928_05850 [Sphingopyxis sp. GW247-27LB]